MGKVAILFGITYLVLGLLVAVFGPEGWKLRQDYKRYRHGTPPEFAKLGLTTCPPAALWKCITYLVLTTLVASVFWPIFIPDVIKVIRRTPNFPDIPREWFREPTTIAREAARNMVTDPRLGPDPVPFGFCNNQWNELVGKFKEGDELWVYSNPPEYWKNLAGRTGLVLLRRGKTIAHMLTLMN